MVYFGGNDFVVKVRILERSNVSRALLTSLYVTIYELITWTPGLLLSRFKSQMNLSLPLQNDAGSLNL